MAEENWCAKVLERKELRKQLLTDQSSQLYAPSKLCCNKATLLILDANKDTIRRKVGQIALTH